MTQVTHNDHRAKLEPGAPLRVTTVAASRVVELPPGHIIHCGGQFENLSGGMGRLAVAVAASAIAAKRVSGSVSGSSPGEKQVKGPDQRHGPVCHSAADRFAEIAWLIRQREAGRVSAAPSR